MVGGMLGLGVLKFGFRVSGLGCRGFPTSHGVPKMEWASAPYF